MKQNFPKFLTFSMATSLLVMSQAGVGYTNDGAELFVRDSFFSSKAPASLPASLIAQPASPNNVRSLSNDLSNGLSNGLQNNPVSDLVSDLVNDPENKLTIAPTEQIAPVNGNIDPQKNVDMSALYYYAKQREHERVDAEIARLQSIYPGFRAPADLYQTAQKQVPDEQSLWDLFARDDFTGIDAEIVRRKTLDPSWVPTPDFSGKLARKKMRFQMSELAKAEDWIGVLSVSHAIDPKRETEVDLVWLLIDAYSAVDDHGSLAKAYHGLLFRDPVNRLSDADLLVTLQKSVRDFPAVEVRRAMTSLWTTPDVIPGIESLKMDLVRKAVADFNERDDISTPIAQYDISRLEQLAIAENSAADLSVLGWYWLKLEKPNTAMPFFERVLKIEPNAENTKGYYLSLSRQGLDNQALEFAQKNLEILSNDPVFLLNVLSPKFTKSNRSVTENILLAYSTAILETSAPDHSEILGWYAYNSRQFEASYAWFDKALSWEENSDRVKGLALSMLRLGKKTDYANLKNQYVGIYPDIWTEVTTARPPQKRKAVTVSQPKTNVKTSYLKSFERKDYKSCLQELDRLSAKGLSTNAWLIRGWCYLAMSRVTEAGNSFANAMTGTGKTKLDAVYGKALTLLRVNQTDDAEALVRSYQLSATRQNELYSEIYYQRARSAFDFKRYDRVITALDARQRIETEPRDLTLMRGWAYHHMGYPNEANTIFRRLNMHIRDSKAAHGAFVSGS